LEFKLSRTKAYECCPLYNMVGEQLKISIHRINSNMTRIRIVQNGNIEFAAVTARKIADIIKNTKK